MNPQPTSTSNNESSSLSNTSLEGNERAEPVAAKDSNTLEEPGENHTETHPTPTENGSDHHVSPTGGVQNVEMTTLVLEILNR